MINKIPKKVLLPKITNYSQIYYTLSKKKITKQYNPINPVNNIKLCPIIKVDLKKDIRYCIDAEEYLQQFYNIKEIYDIKEFNNKINYLKKILLGKNIFLVKTGWDGIWNNLLYSIDKAEEILCIKYYNVIEERYKLYDHKYNLSKLKEYPIKLMCLLYTKELVSFVILSDFSIYFGKIYGFIELNINYINIDEKNIIFSCVKETFLNRFTYNEKTNTFIIQLKNK